MSLVVEPTTKPTTPPPQTPDFVHEGWTLLSQGAEARVWKKDRVVCKERFPKTYRHPILDEQLNKVRGRAEARLLQRCHERNIPVPTVQSVVGNCIYMTYIDGGVSVREYLQSCCLRLHLVSVVERPDHSNSSGTSNGNDDDDDQEDSSSALSLERLAQNMGTLVAKLHYAGIIHGDLTTSNMMMISTKKEKIHDTPICLIDFGLAKSHTSSEERAVDLYVLERALTSTHPDLPATFLNTLLQTYETYLLAEQQQTAAATTATGVKQKNHHQQSTLQRLEQVRQRGRKRECFG
jgi:TP53 regulating kinase and related kinases